MLGFGPLASFPLASIDKVSPSPGAAQLSLLGATPATTYVITTFFTPTYVTSGAQTTVSGGGLGSAFTTTCAYPGSGVALNNLAVISVCEVMSLADPSCTLTTPSGWTLFAQNQTSDNFMHSGWFYRVLNGTESGTVNITTSVAPLNSGGFISTMMTIFTNVDPISIFEGLATGVFNSGSNGSTQSVGGSAVTSTGPNRKFINLYTLRDGAGGATSATPGAGWTDDYNVPVFIIDEVSTVVAAPTTQAAEVRTEVGRWWAHASMALIPATTQPTTFRPPVAALSIAGSANNATSNATVTPAPAALVLSGVTAFAPSPAALVLLGNTPMVIIPGGADDVVVTYIWA